MNKVFDWFVTLGGLYLVAVLWFLAFPNIESDFWRGFALFGFILITPLSLLMTITFFYYGVLGKREKYKVIYDGEE